MNTKDYFEYVDSLTLINGSTIEVKSCEGLNFTNGTPSDYGVRTVTGRAMIIPRLAVVSLHIKDGVRFSGEKAA